MRLLTCLSIDAELCAQPKRLYAVLCCGALCGYTALVAGSLAR